MADEQKAPVAIRITRPYATEEEFLEREFDTLTRTSVILLGAQPRPQGVVLRFEIVLKGGESVLRGEGRVVAHKEKAHAGEPGLTLRFTRLDARSKALVDRASALRDARARASVSSMSGPAVAVAVPVAVPVPPPAPSSDPVASLPPESIPAPSSSGVDRAAPRADAPAGLETSRKPGPPPLPPQVAAPPSSRRGPPPLPPSVTAPVSGAPSSVSLEEIENTQVDASFHRHEAAAPAAPVAAARAAPSPSQAPRPPTKARTPPPPRPLTPAPPVVAARPHSQPPPAGAGPSPRTARTVERPREREALLHRLRARGQALPASRVGEILTKRVAR